VSFDVSGQGSPTDITFNQDGTKMYTCSFVNGGSIFQYTLSTAFDLSTASYDNIVFSISGQEGSPQDVAFSTDGTKMYVVGKSTDSVYQYTTLFFTLPTNVNHTAITTASTNTEFWTDINSMTADDSVNDGAVYYAVSTDDRTTWSIIDDTEGVRNIVRDNAGTWEVNDASDYGTETWVASSENDEFYALEEAVDIDTAQFSFDVGYSIGAASYDSVSFDVSGQDGDPQGIAFNTDGTKMYMVGSSNDSVYQYTLNTAFDLSTASYDSVSFFVSGQDGSPRGITFNTDGTKMYVVGISSDSVYQYTLNTAFDLSTASYDSVSLDVSGQDGSPRGITFNTDGTKMYIVGDNNGSVYQYSTFLTQTDSRNRMDATQLNAVSDANHYTLGNDLDLAITLFMADGNTNSPTSDGVLINYDANVLNQGAVLGTDYEFDAPAGETVRITALSNENFKVKVI